MLVRVAQYWEYTDQTLTKVCQCHAPWPRATSLTSPHSPLCTPSPLTTLHPHQPDFRSSSVWPSGLRPLTFLEYSSCRFSSGGSFSPFSLPPVRYLPWPSYPRKPHPQSHSITSPFLFPLSTSYVKTCLFTTCPNLLQYKLIKAGTLSVLFSVIPLRVSVGTE